MLQRGVLRAFTLIELLIVIAIIAILALIAVPNFLEAQTRAKIARAKADMRTIATAVEAYSVDWGRCPLGATEGWKNPDIHYAVMTTPVAYISSLPEDPFLSMNNSFYKANGGLEIRDPRYVYQSCPPDGKKINGSNMPGVYIEAGRRGLTWALGSVGPSRIWNQTTGIGTYYAAAAAGMPDTANTARYPSAFYDSSNGTVSFGWLVRSNKLNSP